MNNLDKIKKIFFSFSVILISASLIALLYLILLAATSYQVNSGATVTVDEWSACKKVTNNNSLALFVPTNTALEWTTFKTNAPNIILADCFSTPSAPQNLAVAGGDLRTILTWQAPSDTGGGVTNYEVYRGATSGGETLVNTVSSSPLSYSETLSIDYYYYKILATNIMGDGSFTDEISLLNTNSACPSCKYVFVSSNSYGGGLGGLSGADSKCTARASAVGLTGTYKAWLSTDSVSASSRLSHSSVPYKRLDGTTVASNWADLIDGTLSASISINEYTDPVGSPWSTWTNTNTDGSSLGYADCLDWTIGASYSESCTPTGFCYGSSGITSQTNASWTYEQYNSNPCGYNLWLYCIEQ